MSQDAVQQTADTKEEKATSKPGWARNLALVGVFLFVAALFLGGLLKGSEAGAMTTKILFFIAAGCLLGGLAGVGLDALKQKKGKAQA